MCRISPLVLFWLLLSCGCGSQNTFVLLREKARDKGELHTQYF